eukprot:m51a1_g11999 hypothetical protein (228) ;mRNA; f:409-1092
MSRMSPPKSPNNSPASSRQCLELVVPLPWKHATRMTSDEITVAGVRATACLSPRGGADAIRCALCPRVILVQHYTARDLQDSHVVALPGGALAERFSFAVRSQCTGDCTVASTTPFSLNTGRKRSRAAVDDAPGKATPQEVALESPPGRCQELAVPRALPRRFIVRVMVNVGRDPSVAQMVAGVVEYVRVNVAGCVNTVVRFLPGSKGLRFVIVAVWESQQALASGE